MAIPDFKVIKASGATLAKATNKLEDIINPLLVKGYDLVGGVTVIESKISIGYSGDWTVVQSIFRRGSCTIN